jgi:hypothetical protein
MKEKQKKKKNPLEDVLQDLEGYADGCDPEDLLSSGE